MEDERYDEIMWERYEDEGRWTGWQGGYSGRYDPYFEALNDLNARSRAGRRQEYGDALGFESPNRGPYRQDANPSRKRQPRAWRDERGIERRFTRSSPLPPRGGWQAAGPYQGLAPHGWQRPDERIFEEICQRMARHGRLDARQIEVDVRQGQVSLQGSVPDRTSRRLAEDLAASVRGVVDVDNHLKVSA